MEARLACPRCGSTYFYTFSLGGRKIVFGVNGLYLPVALEEDQLEELDHVDPTRIHCAACSWAGGIRELVPSKE